MKIHTLFLCALPSLVIASNQNVNAAKNEGKLAFRRVHQLDKDFIAAVRITGIDEKIFHSRVRYKYRSLKGKKFACRGTICKFKEGYDSTHYPENDPHDTMSVRAIMEESMR